MLERLLESHAPVSSLWGLLGDNPKFYYPEVCNPPGACAGARLLCRGRPDADPCAP